MFCQLRLTFLRSIAILGFVLAAVTWPPSSTAQVEERDSSGGGRSGASPNQGAHFVSNPAAPASSWMSSGPITLAISKSGKTLYGYSTHTGVWDKVHAQNPPKGLSPILTGEMAAIVVGKQAYTFGGKSGRWDSIELAEGPETAAPILDGNVASIVAGKRVHAFSALTGRWDSVEITDTKGPIVPVVDGHDQVRVDVGSKIYMFSAETGRWATADLSVDAD